MEKSHLTKSRGLIFFILSDFLPSMPFQNSLHLKSKLCEKKSEKDIWSCIFNNEARFFCPFQTCKNNAISGQNNGLDFRDIPVVVVVHFVRE